MTYATAPTLRQFDGFYHGSLFEGGCGFYSQMEAARIDVQKFPASER